MLYQLFCLARPMAAGELSAMIQAVGRVVYSTGGVVCDVKSYGQQYLAYKIKGVRGKYEQVCGEAQRAAAVCRSSRCRARRPPPRSAPAAAPPPARLCPALLQSLVAGGGRSPHFPLSLP
jgi:ribosomal protein S6